MQFSQVDNDDSDLNARMCRLIRVLFGCTVRRYFFSCSGSFIDENETYYRYLKIHQQDGTGN